MFRYFMYPIVALIVAIVTLYYAISFYKRDQKNTGYSLTLNYAYFVIAIGWFLFSFYMFNFILKQFLIGG